MPHVLCEEEDSGIAEDELAARALGHLDIDKNVLDTPSAGDLTFPHPSSEFVAGEILRVTKLWANSQVEADGTLAAKEAPYLITRKLLRACSLTPEKTLPALHPFALAFSYVNT